MFEPDEHHVLFFLRNQVDVPETEILVVDRGLVHLIQHLNREQRTQFIENIIKELFFIPQPPH